MTARGGSGLNRSRATVRRRKEPLTRASYRSSRPADTGQQTPKHLDRGDTAMIAFLRGVIAASAAAADNHGSLSDVSGANTGVAPVYAMALTLCHERQRRHDRLVAGTNPGGEAREVDRGRAVGHRDAWAAPTNSPNASSNSAVRGAMVSQPDWYTRVTRRGPPPTARHRPEAPATEPCTLPAPPPPDETFGPGMNRPVDYA